jgi:uncharacterized protein (TIGR02466 family)
MGLMTRDILPLFSTPVYITKNSQLAEEFYPSIRDIDYHRMMSDDGWLSDKTDLLDHEQFKPLKDYILSCVDQYLHEDLHYNRDLEFYLTNSWVTIHKMGDWSPSHNHENSLISGTFYINIPQDDESVFQLHALENRYRVLPSCIALTQNNFDIFNCNIYNIKPETGTLILFPSHVNHNTTQQTSDELRYCLAFNVFARGQLGQAFGVAPNPINKLVLK